MQHPNRDIPAIVQQGLAQNANLYLNSPVNFIGQRGLERLIKEIPSWADTFSEEALEKIYLHLIEFSGSTIPELPKEISGFYSGVVNPHQGGRDKLATALRQYKDAFGIPEWEIAANHFLESGCIIETIVKECVQDVCKRTFSFSKKYILLLKQLQQSETLAFRNLEQSQMHQKRRTHGHNS